MQKEDAALYKVMACLLDVKKRSGRIEASFAPLHDTVRPLVTYTVVISHEASSACKAKIQALQSSTMLRAVKHKA